MMNRLRLLDCTLRDGGYVNDWKFGQENIQLIINNLTKSGIDIIECGFINSERSVSEEQSMFNSIEDISKYISKKSGSMYVAMINFGSFPSEKIPDRTEGMIDGIRVAFHKKDKIEALNLCEDIKRKGFKVFLQPMVSLSYDDYEFLEMLQSVNKIEPYAFYIVDSFGVMKKRDLLRFYHLVNHNLKNDILIGYHSHNNLQLAYSNAQSLVEFSNGRDLIIDSCVFGMGRGAGNLNTELFLEYLNENYATNYRIKPILEVIDEVLNNIYKTAYWGYSLPHYISAKNNCHPNYATYIADKDTLTVDDVNNIVSQLDEDKKNNFDIDYIEKLYLNYQSNRVEDKSDLQELSRVFKNKDIVLIAPGKNLLGISNKLNEIKSLNSIYISLNFRPAGINVDYTFISNNKRLDHFKTHDEDKLIISSNIKNSNLNGFKVNYSELLNDVASVHDNAGLMIIKLLINLGVEKVQLAGFDGYSNEAVDDYVDKDLMLVKDRKIISQLNRGVKEVLKLYSKDIEIEFLTESKYNMEEDI